MARLILLDDILLGKEGLIHHSDGDTILLQ